MADHLGGRPVECLCHSIKRGSVGGERVSITPGALGGSSLPALPSRYGRKLPRLTYNYWEPPSPADVRRRDSGAQEDCVARCNHVPMASPFCIVDRGSGSHDCA